MKWKHDVLMLGASYGSLLAAKLMLAGDTVKLVCLPAEAELINREGSRNLVGCACAGVRCPQHRARL